MRASSEMLFSIPQTKCEQFLGHEMPNRLPRKHENVLTWLEKGCQAGNLAAGVEMTLIK